MGLFSGAKTLSFQCNSFTTHSDTSSMKFQPPGTVPEMPNFCDEVISRLECSGLLPHAIDQLTINECDQFQQGCVDDAVSEGSLPIRVIIQEYPKGSMYGIFTYIYHKN